VAAAQQRACELDTQLQLLLRSLKEAEAAALDWQSRASQLDDARQELVRLLSSNDTAMKQVRQTGTPGQGSMFAMPVQPAQCCEWRHSVLLACRSSL